MIKAIRNNRVCSIKFERDDVLGKCNLYVEPSMEDFGDSEKIVRDSPVWVSMDCGTLDTDVNMTLDREEAAALRDFIDQLLKETE
jgi:hypothetical protein